jgi:hypothetical protein
MSPLAALQQQFEQKQRGPWHRRLSPLKKKQSSSSFSSARPLATSSSISPQRRPPSPEKRQRPVPIYQQMNGAKNGCGTFQEAWEHLSRQCAASISEQRCIKQSTFKSPNFIKSSWEFPKSREYSTSLTF